MMSSVAILPRWYIFVQRSGRVLVSMVRGCFLVGGCVCVWCPLTLALSHEGRGDCFLVSPHAEVLLWGRGDCFLGWGDCGGCV